MSHLQSKGLGHTNINSFNHIPKAFFLQNLEKKHTSQNLLNQEIFKFFVLPILCILTPLQQEA